MEYSKLTAVGRWTRQDGAPALEKGKEAVWFPLSNGARTFGFLADGLQASLDSFRVMESYVTVEGTLQRITEKIKG